MPNPVHKTGKVPKEVDTTSGILAAIGNTPLVRLDRLFGDHDIELFVKLEAFNPGGSIKDRPAIHMLQDALQRGLIDHDTMLVESSSGNLAIGLAQACAALGLKLTVVVDPKACEVNLRLVEAYGARIDRVTTPDPATGEYLAARRARIRELLDTLPNAYNLNQYANPKNPEAHATGTVAEVLDQLGNDLDYLFVAVSSCGTLRGAAQVIEKRGLATRIIAVDAAGSAIYGKRGLRLLPGHGAGVVPELMQPGLSDGSVLVTDADCVAGCRTLAAREAILAGASGGGAIAAINQMLPQLPAGSTIATILADRGERYLDTVYDDAWCIEHFGSVPQLGDVQKQAVKERAIA